MGRSVQRGEDSLKWTIERACADAQRKTAVSNAKGGGRTVLLTGRKMSAEELAELAAVGVEVIPSR